MSRSFAATLGLSCPYTRSRHSRGPTTKTDDSAGANVQTVLGTSKNSRGESTSSLHGNFKFRNILELNQPLEQEFGM